MANIFTVAQLVRNELPAGFVVTDPYIALNLQIQQSLIYKAAEISEENKFTEAQWPDSWNLLLAYLIVYGVLQTALLGGVIINAGTGLDGSVGAGQTKKILTGPTEVEWQDSAAAFSTLVKNLTTGKDSVFQVIMSNACLLSRMLGIKIPFCKGLQIGAMFMKSGQCYHYNQLWEVLTYEYRTVSNQTIIESWPI